MPDCNDYAYWNFDATDESLTVCKNQHDRNESCESHMEKLCPHEALHIINELRAGYLHLKAKIDFLTK